ncbi:hypothetical protein DJ66_0432 [Candidatus Liberibacter solanacearum]|uniref:Uncharacterized protein n=1 Tax=Candidatus Liberibacter solanacearum TaxID=556287 RepID=A0A0F4VKE8_9HYPH|nr:hypothetical protein DJ66_0432 [Candidatus Liberibacter solanacearum]
MILLCYFFTHGYAKEALNAMKKSQDHIIIHGILENNKYNDYTGIFKEKSFSPEMIVPL